MKIYRRILKYVKKYRRSLITSIVMSVFFSVFSALSVYLTIPLLKTLFMGKGSSNETETAGYNFSNILRYIQYQFEQLISERDIMSAIVLICVLIFFAFLLKNISGFFRSISMQYVEKGVIKDIRDELYQKINKLSLRYFSTEKTGNLISRMTNDLNNIQSGISASFDSLLKEPLVIIIFLLLALSISWQMTLIAVVIFPLTVIFIRKIGDSLRRRSQRALIKLSELVSLITETIYGAKIIRSFRAEKYKDKIFEEENYKHYKLTMRSAYAFELASPITETLSILAGVIIIWFGGRQIFENHTLKPEEFLGFLFIIFQIIVPIKNLASVNNRIQESVASGERIFEILDYPIEVNEIENAKDLENFKTAIEIKNAGFSYDGHKNVLKNINLTINKSDVIAVVGQSGVGKSTLADLISRFYDLTEGEILIDGINIRELKISSLRNLIGIVPQETILFNDTIRSNIIFGKEGVDEATLIETSKFANAYNFIMETEKGFDTVVGERGLKLSGGQKQRIAIARALLRNPQIFILDEATSSLDTESENLVQEALEKLMTNRTSIIIAHRLSTVRNAKRIIVLDNGTIAQSGTHDELIKVPDGVYKKLYEFQFN
jgi:ATP-binding cassette, subfamily B, bacterial MsbA